ncbi:MAG: asparagine synthase, partial [Peptidiphaga gingivicola]
MTETLIEGRRSESSGPSPTRVPPGLEWRVLDEGRRERTVRFGVAFDVSQAMRDAVAALPDEVTARRAAEELANTDGSGVAVLFDGAQTIALVPAWSGQALYWAVKDGVLLLSTSARSIAKEIGTAVSRNFLASFLVDGLPLGVASRIAPWDGVQALAPFEALRVDRNLTGRNFKARPIQIPPVFERPGESEEDVDNAVAALRQALFEATFRWCERGGPISCDVSGGVDSAANAYLLRALHVHFDATHASSSSQYNLDDMWAKRIVNDVGASAAFYPALGSTGLTFDAEAAFPNGYIPETPVM